MQLVTGNAAHASKPASTATPHLEAAPLQIGIDRSGATGKAEMQHQLRQFIAEVEAAALGGTAKADAEAAKATVGQQTSTSTKALMPTTVLLVHHRHHRVITAEAAEEEDRVLVDRVGMPDHHRPPTSVEVPRSGSPSMMLGPA